MAECNWERARSDVKLFRDDVPVFQTWVNSAPFAVLAESAETLAECATQPGITNDEYILMSTAAIFFESEEVSRLEAYLKKTGELAQFLKWDNDRVIGK
jgi:hypothetical protein